MSNLDTWPDERVAELRKLWPEPKMSASKIAALIFPAHIRKRFPDGGRNAVIGKAHRLGLPAKREARQEPMHPADRRAKRSR